MSDSPKPKRKGARPGEKRACKYKPEYAEQVYKLCLLNALDKDIADFFGVSTDTILNWSKKYPEFAQARHDGKMKADAEVASRLFDRAVGMKIKKQKVLNDGSIVTYEEELPPDVKAAESWLFCRTRKSWDWKAQVEVSGSSENPLQFILGEVARVADKSPLPGATLNLDYAEEAEIVPAKDQSDE